MENNLRPLLENYRRAEQALRLFRQSSHPTGCRVMVDAEKYKGQGVVVADSLCPITQIPVRLENGNVWYYDLTDCSPATHVNKPKIPSRVTELTAGLIARQAERNSRKRVRERHEEEEFREIARRADDMLPPTNAK